MKKIFTLVAVTMLAAVNLRAYTTESPEDALAFFGLSPCEFPSCDFLPSRLSEHTLLHAENEAGMISSPEAKPSVMLEDHAPWAKETWRWSYTNPDVKPYKVMDDLTFVGVPVFVAGIIAKKEKKSFRQNVKDNKHTLVTDFKTSIDN